MWLEVISQPDGGDGRDCLCILRAAKQKAFQHYNKSDSAGKEVTVLKQK